MHEQTNKNDGPTTANTFSENTFSRRKVQHVSVFLSTTTRHRHNIILQKKVVLFLNVMAVPDGGFEKNLKHVAGFRQQMVLSKNMVVSDVTPVY
jgi:hypothetical protein